MTKKAAKSVGTTFAYTPGLKVRRQTTVSKTRMLPLPGELLVKVGDKVDFDQIVARTYTPGDVEMLPVTSLLGVDTDDLPLVMKKKVGDKVKKDEQIAFYSAFFGLIKRSANSPVDGTVESVSKLTGRVMLREAPKLLTLSSYIPGEVVKVISEEGLVIETNAAFLQGIFGIGGETHGEIKMAVKAPDEGLKPDMITAEDKGKILVGGSFATEDALRKAAETGVKGVVTGGIRDVELFNFVGEEIGVAITGREEVGLSFIITEGFGEIAMSERSFNLLQEFEGYQAAMSGATQIRAGVLRPEIIIPHPKFELKISASADLSGGMAEGTPVRIIREPYFGAIGVVSTLPVELQKLQSESMVRIVEVDLQDGTQVRVPRANVEIIEE